MERKRLRPLSSEASIRFLLFLQPFVVNKRYQMRKTDLFFVFVFFSMFIFFKAFHPRRRQIFFFWWGGGSKGEQKECLLCQDQVFHSNFGALM